MHNLPDLDFPSAFLDDCREQIEQNPQLSLPFILRIKDGGEMDSLGLYFHCDVVPVTLPRRITVLNWQGWLKLAVDTPDGSMALATAWAWLQRSRSNIINLEWLDNPGAG